MLSSLFNWLWGRDTIPKKWRRIGILKSVHLFPIKSCAPIQLTNNTEFSCDILGLRLDGVRDRGLMLINDKNEMITARNYPKMVLIGVEILAPRKILFTYKGVESSMLDFCEIGQEHMGKDLPITIWDTAVDVMRCGEKYDQWFSTVLLGTDSGLHLIYYPYPKPVRNINRNLIKEPYIKKEDTGAFNDSSSYTLMNLASIDDLGRRLNVSLEPLRFRGNFYIEMDEREPYAEDNWHWIRIGDDKVFRVVAPCILRCMLPNIDIATGERDQQCQPIKMLETYRMHSKYEYPVLGVHLGLRQSGVAIKANDIVYIDDH